MYRLLVVDDEPAVVRGLVSYFSGLTNIELEVLSAYNAMDALKWLNQAKIDIMLTDLQMPGMSGIDLLKEVMRRWPRCKVIFLTGHSDFAYVREAIRNGGFDYLHKNEGNEAALQAVNKAIGKMNEEWNADHILAKAKAQMYAANGTLQKEFLWNVLQGDAFAIRRLEEQIRELRIELREDIGVLLIAGRVDGWKEEYSTRDKALLFFSVQNIAAEYLEPMADSYSFFYHNSKLIWFVQFKNANVVYEEDREEIWGRTARYVHGILEMIQQSCDEWLGIKLTFAVADQPCEWRRTAELFERLNIILASETKTGQQRIMRESDWWRTEPQIGQKIDVNWRIRQKALEQMKVSLDNGMKEVFFDSFREFVRTNETLDGESDWLRMEMYFSIFSLLTACMNRWQLQDKLIGKVDVARLLRPDLHGSWGDSLDDLATLAETIFGSRKSIQQQQENKIVTKVKQFIDHNLNGDLSLTHIGEVIGINPSYLSRTFKECTGQGLTDYAMSCKIEEAKRLLVETQLKQHEISEKLGFSSPNYFHTCFKKLMQMTPQEFRIRVGC